MSALVKEQDSEDIAAIFTVAASDVFFLRAILRAGSFTRKRYIGKLGERSSMVAREHAGRRRHALLIDREQARQRSSAMRCQCHFHSSNIPHLQNSGTMELPTPQVRGMPVTKFAFPRIPKSSTNFADNRLRIVAGEEKSGKFRTSLKRYVLLQSHYDHASLSA